MSTIKQVTQATFTADVLQSAVPVVVDFYADWCGPCRMLSPVLQKVAGEIVSKVKVVKVDVDANPQLAAQYRVDGIPTLAFFSGGRLVGRTSGLMSDASLRQTFDRLATVPGRFERQVG